MKQMNLSFIWKCSSIQIPAQSYENFFLLAQHKLEIVPCKNMIKNPLLEKLFVRYVFLELLLVVCLLKVFIELSNQELKKMHHARVARHITFVVILAIGELLTQYNGH